MSYKRSRTVFEADNSIQYGTPLPPLDPDIRDDGTFVPVWKQDAVDDRGQKRFHGAFTGGFSAGYFNTVGSKQGWTPATFLSSRTNRAKDKKENVQQRAEDFMDEEDLADQEGSKQLQTNDSFSGIGSTSHDSVRQLALVDLMKPSLSIGVTLLEKMGWKQGQGLGPSNRSTVNRHGSRLVHQAAHKHQLPPIDTPILVFDHKTDRKGLGLANHQAGRHTTQPGRHEVDDQTLLNISRSRVGNNHKSSNKAAFGVGVLNDDGSGDEDPYDIGPKISYTRTLNPTTKPKRPVKPIGLLTSSANPTLTSKPVFVSRKKIGTASDCRKCHDGRLPLDGFILHSTPYQVSHTNYTPPKAPPDWLPVKTSKTPNQNTSSSYQSTAAAARSSSLNPTSRASIIGEAELPGKSIFDFLSPAARHRLASATGKEDLPPARGEALPVEYQKSHPEKQNQDWTCVPHLDTSTAKAALDRADAGGFMPYADNECKRDRYLVFLQLKAGITSTLPTCAVRASNDEWIAEMREFVKAAQVFRPMTGLMASRFTSSHSTGENGQSAVGKSTSQDPAEEAAKLRMYGPLTRLMQDWTPDRLLCKRFAVRPPAVSDVPATHAGESRASHAVPKSATSHVQQQTTAPAILAAINPEAIQLGYMAPSNYTAESVKLDPERNHILDQQRPGDAVFKAIFGSDDEGED